jgi:putative tryptophan/tyrosine transport system substrate-binding protein
VRRREVLRLLAGTAVGWPLSVRAQQKIPRIGFMGNSTAALEVNLVNSFREGLREVGYEGGAISLSTISGRKENTNGFLRW